MDERTKSHSEPGMMAWELTKREEFNLLTGETDDIKHRSTLLNSVVHVKVYRVFRKKPRWDV
jgi:hypothetical protein